jgi:HK97 family phage major capsid protein
MADKKKEEGKEPKNKGVDNPFEQKMAELVERVKTFEKKFEEKLKKQIDEINEKGAPNEALGKELQEDLEKRAVEMKAVQDELTSLRQLTDKLDFPEGGGQAKSIADQFYENEKLKEFMERGWHSGSVAIPLTTGLFSEEKKTLFPREGKTTITSGTVGSSTPGILTPTRVVDYVPAAQRRLTIRDLLPSQTVTSNAIEYPKENAFTNAASPQTEGSDKAESALTFTIESANVRTIAHWIPATAQVLDDWGQLRRIIDNKMMYGLKLKEETELLMGDGLGVHISGLITNATAYAGTYDVAADTVLDRLRWGILEIEDGDEEADFIVLNPVQFYQVLGIKDQASNVGNYVAGNPVAFGAAQPVNFWGKSVVVTNSMTAGKFLVGNSQQCSIFDRMAATLVISTEHSDYFIKNMVAIRVEERLAFAMYRDGAFVYGDTP